jgi:hypothetical protein
MTASDTKCVEAVRNVVGFKMILMQIEYFSLRLGFSFVILPKVIDESMEDPEGDDSTCER